MHWFVFVHNYARDGDIRVYSIIECSIKRFPGKYDQSIWKKIEPKRKIPQFDHETCRLRTFEEAGVRIDWAHPVYWLVCLIFSRVRTRSVDRPSGLEKFHVMYVSKLT